MSKEYPESLTEDELQYILKQRGGCHCGHPNASPPCSNCENPITDEEYFEAKEWTMDKIAYANRYANNPSYGCF